MTSRCVRRAYLCGQDPTTGFNFDHRRQWLENQILKLSNIFAVELLGYAVMSNHYHLILTTNPILSMNWTDEDVADRWLQIFPGSGGDKIADLAREERKEKILRDPNRIKELRDRLSSLSWFMRRLNEPLARIANQEDECTGRFWEGRFKSQQILDETALLACLVYVDLNPIRAGIADRIEDATHTSIHSRLSDHQPGSVLTALNNSHSILGQGYTLQEYLALLVWTAESQQDSKPISYWAQQCISKSALERPESWRERMPRPGCWQRALGSAAALKDYAVSLGQNWIKTTIPS